MGGDASGAQPAVDHELGRGDALSLVAGEERDRTGWPIGGRASGDREEIVYAGADLADARRRRSWNEYNQLLRDRRGDVYAEMLGADAWPGWYRTTGPGAVAPG